MTATEGVVVDKHGNVYTFPMNINAKQDNCNRIARTIRDAAIELGLEFELPTATIKIKVAGVQYTYCHALKTFITEADQGFTPLDSILEGKRVFLPAYNQQERHAKVHTICSAELIQWSLSDSDNLPISIDRDSLAYYAIFLGEGITDNTPLIEAKQFKLVKG